MFKSATILTLNPVLLPDEIPEELLFKPTLEHQEKTMGLVPAVGQDYLYHQNGATLVRVQIQKRTVPASAVNREALARAKGEKLSKKVMSQLKTEIKDEFMPRAFPTDTFVDVCIDQVIDVVYMDATSESVVQDVLKLLAKLIPGFAPRYRPARAQDLLTMSQGMPVYLNISLTENAVFNVGEGTVEFKGVSWEEDEDIMGMPVAKIGICWMDNVTCMLHEDGTLSKIKFESFQLGKHRNADFALVAPAIRHMIKDMS